MAAKTLIEWTDATWNPARGCTSASPGCANCYARTMMERFRDVPGHPFEQGFDVRLAPEKLAEPLTWAKSRAIFVGSVTDIFHPDIPNDYIVRIFEVMEAANWHVFQVLTKRAERMRRMLDGPLRRFGRMRHIWWGVTAENQKDGLARINHLRHANVANRFVSFEPLLEDMGSPFIKDINWVIVGGETGRNARPMAIEWALALRNQCTKMGIPFFFKQQGAAFKGPANFDLGQARPGMFYGQEPSRAERLELVRESRAENADIINNGGTK